MKLELHILQNFAPSNLNRDDTGAPKDCELGGFRRARISSQCLKRAMRRSFEIDSKLAEGERTARTKRLVERIAVELKEKNRDLADARQVARATLEGAGFGVKEEKGEIKTEYLLFVPERSAKAIAETVDKEWNSVLELARTGGDKSAKKPPPEAAMAEIGKGAAQGGDNSKKKRKAEFPKKLGQEIDRILKDASHAPALALFGRMIADKPDWNVNAACQVAHALSTNRVSMEFDFYTAVDDFKPEETAGSDMMGSIQFNSACFYRYSVVDVDALAINLGEPSGSEIVAGTVAAYVRAAIQAIPTGKQNGMAAHNPPSYVLAIAREDGVPISLANAFLKPVRPSPTSDLVGESIAALGEYLANVSRMHGMGKAAGVFCADREVKGIEPFAKDVKDCEPEATPGDPPIKPFADVKTCSALVAQVAKWAGPRGLA